MILVLGTILVFGMAITGAVLLMSGLVFILLPYEDTMGPWAKWRFLMWVMLLIGATMIGGSVIIFNQLGLGEIMI